MSHARVVGRDLSDARLYQLCKTYGYNARVWLRKFALLLPEVQYRQLHKRRGFASIHEFAAKLAGMSHGAVDDALRILERVNDKPALRAVAEEFGFQRVKPVVYIATRETQGFWAEKARMMSKHALEIYVKNYRLKSIPGDKSESVKSTVTLTLELSPETVTELQKLKGSGDWEDLFKELLETRRNALEREKPDVVRTESRHIPLEIQRWVLAKTRGQCGYPGCTRPYYQLHHTQRWALDRVHDPDQIVPLCKTHNELAHRTLIDHEEGPPVEWQLRRDPDRTSPKYAIDQRVAECRMSANAHPSLH